MDEAKRKEIKELTEKSMDRNELWQMKFRLLLDLHPEVRSDHYMRSRFAGTLNAICMSDMPIYRIKANIKKYHRTSFSWSWSKFERVIKSLFPDDYFKAKSSEKWKENNPDFWKKKAEEKRVNDRLQLQLKLDDERDQRMG